ncbi:hypothetical protein M426DRAFT_264693 [Hypoxylon sp. CI-4A]|nr:hypothetical protein M426DRAFT_264693 [Hypoxylon sp. CI-4A]
MNSWDEMGEEEEEMREFYYRYHKAQKVRDNLKVDFTATRHQGDVKGLGEFNPETADLVIKCETGESWKTSSDIVSKQSNYFRAALRHEFKETQDGVFTLPGFKREILEFLVAFFHKGWHKAVEDTFGSFNYNRLPMADILAMADYLDVPVLCWEVYNDIENRLARFGIEIQWEDQWRKKVQLQKRIFWKLARNLEATKIYVGMDIADSIRRYFTRISDAQESWHVSKAFLDIFLDDRSAPLREPTW